MTDEEKVRAKYPDAIVMENDYCDVWIGREPLSKPIHYDLWQASELPEDKQLDAMREIESAAKREAWADAAARIEASHE